MISSAKRIYAMAATFSLTMMSPVVADSTIGQFLDDTLLVRADVVEVMGVEGGMTRTKQEIRHHYSGRLPPELKTFVVFSGEASGGGTFSGRAICPALSLGEEGIWLLQERDGTLFPANQGQFQIAWPARHVVACGGASGSIFDANKAAEPNTRFAAIAEMAEAAATVWSQPDESERLRLVKVYAQHLTPEVARWAIIVLSETYPSELLLNGNNWSRSGILLQALPTLDETLCTIRSVEWRDTDARKSLLDHLVESGRRGELQVQTVVNHLAMAIQRKQIDPEVFLELDTRLIDDKSLPYEMRAAALGLLRYVTNDNNVGERAVERLITNIENGPDLPLGQAALSALASVKHLGTDHRARIVALRDSAEVHAGHDDGTNNGNIHLVTSLGEIIKRTDSTRDQ